MENQTRDNIIRKRKIKKRRRRLKIFRLLIFLFIVGGILWTGFQICQLGFRMFHSYYSLYQDYVHRQDLQESSLEPRFVGYTNILIMGLDEGMETGQQADAILLLSIEDATGAVRIMSIPGGTLAPITGHRSWEKVSETYAYGGALLTKQTVSALTGIPVQQYIAIDTKTLSDIVNVLGGIDFYVECDMDYEDPEEDLSIHIKKGYQHMDGNTVQQYLRYRGGELGNIGRVQRQNHFLKVFYERLFRVGTVTRLPLLADIFQNHVITNMELLDTLHFTKLLRKFSSDEPRTIMLPGGTSAADDTLWIASPDSMEQVLSELFPAATENGN